MLQPKRRKYRKDFRGRRKGISVRGSEISFGDYGLKALEVAWITSNQIEAGRRVIARSIKRGGKVWVRVFPDKPVTARPAGKRMGGGKGEISGYVAVVRPGKIIYELGGVPKEVAFDALGKVASKLPIRTKVVAKEG